MSVDSRAHVVALETAEIAALADVYRGAGDDLAARAGLRVENLDGATLLAATRVDVLALNRVVGIGLDGRPGDGPLGTMLETMRRVGSPRFFIPVAPLDANRDLPPRLEALGIRHYNNWMRLSRTLADVPDMPVTDLRVRRARPDDAAVFGEIVATAFSYPPDIALLASRRLGHPNWTHYLALDNGTPVATAAMYVCGDAAWFGFAATAAAARRRGAQSALVARRLIDAAEAGCRWVSVETAEDTIDRDAPSFRNLRRLGFEVVYRRPNHLWVASTGTAAPA